MAESRVQVVTTIEFGSEKYSINYQISDEFDSERTRKTISLCEHALMQSWCGHLNVNGMFSGHWLPSGKSTNVTFEGCPIEIVKDTADIIRRIIDAKTVEEVTIDARSIRDTRKTNRQTAWID